MISRFAFSAVKFPYIHCIQYIGIAEWRSSDSYFKFGKPDLKNKLELGIVPSLFNNPNVLNVVSSNAFERRKSIFVIFAAAKVDLALPCNKRIGSLFFFFKEYDSIDDICQFHVFKKNEII